MISRPSSSSPDRPAAQEQAALEWLARLDRGLTPEQEAEFERWLAGNPQHAEAFGEFDGTWSLLNRLRETPEAAGARGRPDPDVFAPRRTRWSRARRWALPLAAAAVIAGGVLARWSASPGASRGGAELTLAAASDASAPRRVALPDGSTIQLNRASGIEVRFSAAERRVVLVRGEAHFTVAGDPARPFIVRASGVDVRAVGTAFNVRLQPEAVEVLVTEGKVRVHDEQGRGLLRADLPVASVGAAEARPAGGERALVAGEKVTIALALQSSAVPRRATPVAVAAIDIDRALAWQARQLEFVSAPLAEMIAEFNRHNRQQIVIEDPGLAQQRFGGTFLPDDVAGFVRLLEAHFGVVAERGPDKIVLRPAR